MANHGLSQSFLDRIASQKNVTVNKAKLRLPQSLLDRIASQKNLRPATAAQLRNDLSIAESDPHYFGFRETDQEEKQALGEQSASRFLGVNAEDVAAVNNFVPNETSSSALLQIIDDCMHFDGRCFFQNHRENRIAMFVPAYLLLLELVRGGEAAIKFAISRMPSDTRSRRPSLTKPELIAVQLTAKPETEPQRKLCSDYGSLLMVARVKGLSPADFVAWIEEADIGDCKVKAKKIRAALKAGLPAEIDDDAYLVDSEAAIDEPWVQISHGRGPTLGASYSASIPEVMLSPVADVIEGGDVSSNLAAILRRVADMLELAECTECPVNGDIPPL